MDNPRPSPSEQPRRSILRRARLPLVSGKTSVAILLLCLGVTGVWIIPLARVWPPWIDVEIVLGLWWIIWAITLGRLLYSGRRISDDHSLGSPRNWFSGGTGSSPSSGCSLGWLDFPLSLDGCAVEGCASLIAIVAVVMVALVGVWLLVEVLIPMLAFVMYFLVRGMLAKVANDEHGCEGNLPRSAGWGALWATIYIAPVALLVWVIHLLHKPAAV